MSVKRAITSNARLFTTSSRSLGVKIDSISPGDGKSFPKKGDTVSIHYTGKLQDGKVFDSSVSRGVPFQSRIGVGQLIKGWDEGIPQLSVGEKARLTCTPDFAYGSQSVGGGLIPANSTLVFDVELISIDSK